MESYTCSVCGKLNDNSRFICAECESYNGGDGEDDMKGFIV